MTLNSPDSRSVADTGAKRVTLGLFLLSFFLHIAVALAIHHYLHPITWENGGIAQYLYEGKGFRIDYFGLNAEPTSIQAPGYPVVLWTFWTLFGQTSTAYLLVSVTQCLAVASMVWPVGSLSRRWFPDTPAWIAQTFVALYPLYIWYATRIHHTAYVMALHPWLLWTWLLQCRRGTWQAIATGILSGIAGLFQPVLLGVYGILGAALLVAALLNRQWNVAMRLIVAAIAVIVCLTPWTIRNYQVHHRLILVKSGMAKEFWMGNNPHATGTSFAAGGANEITNVYPPKAYALYGKIHEIEMMDALNAEAWSYIKANPGKTLSMTAKKLLWFWTIPPRDLVRSSEEGESLTYRVVAIVYWTTIVASAALGVIFSRGDLREYLPVLMIYIMVYSAIYGMTHVGQARFRGEIEFIFLFPAAAGFWFLLSSVSKRNSNREDSSDERGKIMDDSK